MFYKRKCVYRLLVVKIGATAYTASEQPVCDLSNREHSLTPSKPFYATLTVRINNRKQQQSLAQVRMSRKVFFSIIKNDTKVTLAAIESACLISRKQAETGVSRYTLMSSRDFRHRVQGIFDRDIRGALRGS